MGSAFGYIPDNAYHHYMNPELHPGPNEEPSFDPNLGFPKGRKPRVMIATDAEMRSAKLELKDRDYCAHKLIDYMACRNDNFPFVVLCAHEKHQFLQCKYDDFVIRSKEFEREKRLRKLRDKQRKAKEKASTEIMVE